MTSESHGRSIAEDRTLICNARNALTLLALALSAAASAEADEEDPGPAGTGLPGVTDVLVDGENCRGAHVSTRPHNRKVVHHAPSGRWFLFYGTGHWTDKLGDAGGDKERILWRATTDGVTFTPVATAIAGRQGHSSSTDVLLVGDRIYVSETRFGHWRTKAGVPALLDGKMWYHRDRVDPTRPSFYCPYEVFPFRIAEDKLIAEKEAEALPGDKHVAHAGPHYGSLTRDTRGYFWVGARAQGKGYGKMSTWVARTARPDDISKWLPHTSLLASTEGGTHAPQVIALDEGRVACVLFSQPDRHTAVYLHDPASGKWGEPHVIGRAYKSKRHSAVFDPGSRRLHVVYTDQDRHARHRALADPYGRDNWSPPLGEPGTLVVRVAGGTRGDDDLSLSADLSKNPAPLALVCRRRDRRLHLTYYDGRAWSDKIVKVGLRDPAWTCDEASAVADFSHGLAFVYWCQWKDPEVRKQKDGIGQLRFCLVRDVAALFAGK